MRLSGPQTGLAQLYKVEKWLEVQVLESPGPNLNPISVA